MKGRLNAYGENAFTLLNRAAGLKQLSSIDDIFRELVLDDTSTFERAAEVAKEFDDLTAIHNELELARQQQRALQPIAETWSKRGSLIELLDRQRTLRSACPIWYATHGHRLWGQEVGRIGEQLTAKESESQQLTLRITSLDQQAQALRDTYLRVGGAGIEDLRGQIETQRELVAQRCRNADDYIRLAKRLGLSDDLTSAAVLANQARARELPASKGDALAKERQEAWQLGATQQRHHEELNKLTADLQQARARPGSNIAGHYQEFRADLAAELDVAEHQLPFVGELIEVKPDEVVGAAPSSVPLEGTGFASWFPPSASSMHQASERGIESFLGALDEGDHWLLIAPLEPALLPFARQAVPAAELMPTGLPGTHLLVVENERSLHQLPSTVAVLGSGLNRVDAGAVAQIQNRCLLGRHRYLGRTMLVAARAQQPHLQPLLMDSGTFEIYQALAVPEPNPAGDSDLATLSEAERRLYRHIRGIPKGRLEQEFLPREAVAKRNSALARKRTLIFTTMKDSACSVFNHSLEPFSGAQIEMFHAKLILVATAQNGASLIVFFSPTPL